MSESVMETSTNPAEMVAVLSVILLALSGTTLVCAGTVDSLGAAMRGSSRLLVVGCWIGEMDGVGWAGES